MQSDQGARPAKAIHLILLGIAVFGVGCQAQPTDPSGTGGASVGSGGEAGSSGTGGGPGTGGVSAAAGGSKGLGGTTSSGGSAGHGGANGSGGEIPTGGAGGSSGTGGTNAGGASTARQDAGSPDSRAGQGGNPGGQGGGGAQGSGGAAGGDDAAVGKDATAPDLAPIPDAPPRLDTTAPFWTTAYAANCTPPAIGGRSQSDGHHRAGEDCMRSGCHLNPKKAEHHAGTDCRGSGCHANGSPDGSGAPAFSFGGTVYRAATLVADPGVEVTVKTASTAYTACSASNGNFWQIAASGTTTLSWSGASARLRNANGEAAMMTAVAAGCNATACHAGSLKMTSP